MHHAFLPALCLAVSLAGGAFADSLNKCIDAHGKVTYSNLPCRNARETRKIEIDPAPQPGPAPRANPAEKPAPAGRKEAAPRTGTRNASRASVTRATGKCESLSDKLGRTLDKMDAARRSGYTLKQWDEWNREVQEIERQKRQAGCF